MRLAHKLVSDLLEETNLVPSGHTELSHSKEFERTVCNHREEKQKTMASGLGPLSGPKYESYLVK